MLALIEGEVVDKKHWLTHAELNEIFAIGESTPGPIAINVATLATIAAVYTALWAKARKVARRA